MAMQSTPSRSSGNGVKLVLAWGFVGIPLVWGVVQTLINAIKAFH
ncbi:MAG: oxalate:formate antiporter [Alphaproteobacteria bacterium]|nr:oxalate:formate antiporter [Alphaproteobacteria bacterium]MBV9587888.1 oxalate:formate antiporter [Alphaproteobacteria bacterium]MBV9967510.1 oxalate:formate antiporter [Alphaproteobacteria bacterium]